MNAKPEFKLPVVSEEQATAQIRAHFKPNKRYLAVESFLQELLWPVEHEWKDRQQSRGPMVTQPTYNHNTNAGVYHQVLWTLVGRGILYLSPTTFPSSVTLDYYPMAFGEVRQDQYFRPTFILTPYGDQWLEEEDGVFNCLPTEYGRFSEFLSGYHHRYGDGYLARSREAVGCYKAKLYLSCCVMCGAACESIILQIRIEQTGDEQKVVGDYAAKQGLEKLINNMTHNRTIDGLVKRMEDIRELG
jgi:hypothetical protein